jgi:type III pantothenate kinase
MIFAIDVGNSNIAIGCVNDRKVLFREQISTNQQKTSLEYAIDFKIILELHRIVLSEIEGCIISSVVPPLSRVLYDAAAKILHKTPFLVGPGLKTGLKIMIDNPAQLGSDLVVGAVAAIAEYPVPSIQIDMETATTFSVVGSKNEYLGGAIVPGVLVALDSLSSRTSQLPSISLTTPKKAIGTNTIDCMKSGSVFGSAAMIDGMIDRINQELSADATVIATGSVAGHIIPHCRHHILYDRDLMLKGLELLYRKNQ